MPINSRQLRQVLKLLPSGSSTEDVERYLLKLVNQVKDEERKKKDPLWWASKKKFDKPRTCEVEVSRTGFGSAIITIFDAESERDAAERAWDEAGNESYSEHDSEYEVQSVS